MVTTRRDGAGRRGSSRRRSDAARRAAYDVLAAVADRAAYANLLLPKVLAERSITGRDAALATELAYGTLRGLGTYDAMLTVCSDRPLDELDPPVLRVLRLGAHQLLATRIGNHAAVATSVDLAKDVVGPRVAGYVNAVLRRVSTRDLDQWLALVAPDRETDPDGYLAVRYSYPRWIIGAYREALGDPSVAELEAALAAGNDRPRVTMAAFPCGPGREDVMPQDAEPSRWSPYGFTLAGGDPAGLVAAGQAAVQDEASQLAAIALAAAPTCGARGPGSGTPGAWLDMCAGPGGKARLLYGLAESAGARLAAADVHPHRAALVKAALDSVPHGVPAAGPGPVGPSPDVGAGAAVVVADSTWSPWRDAAFDRVLVDVPCSGLGALRRRPEARWRKTESDIPALTELQRSLLRSAIAATRPGGVVGYVTCSPVPAETSDVVNAVVSGTDGVEILDAPAILPEVPDLRSASPRFAQFWPHRHGTDAIFVALLRRSGQ
jgi:16S rRNA (cytosine967-C5)-methyltransferase